MSPWRLRQIAKQVERGALIAYPTDTIWGFGCYPLSSRAVNRLQQLKQRSQGKGLILLSSKLNYLKPFIDDFIFNTYNHQLSLKNSKPVTWIVKSSKHCPGWLTGYSNNIAIRLTQVPQVNIICQSMQSPIVSTSANVSGRAPVRNSFQAHKKFHHKVDYIIEGFDTGSQSASEIRELNTNKILRP